jgi:hypothetical protein
VTRQTFAAQDWEDFTLEVDVAIVLHFGNGDAFSRRTARGEATQESRRKTERQKKLANHISNFRAAVRRNSRLVGGMYQVEV